MMPDSPWMSIVAWWRYKSFWRTDCVWFKSDAGSKDRKQAAIRSANWKHGRYSIEARRLDRQMKAEYGAFNASSGCSMKPQWPTCV